MKVLGHEPPVPAAASEPTEPATFERAMHRAGRLLEVRARTEREMRDRLGAAGFDAVVVDLVIERLRALDLVNDDAFARRWVEERSRTKGLAPAALVAELEAKGIGRAAAEAVVSEAGVDEQAAAAELARRLVIKVAGHSLEVQARRLEGRLLRRGYSPEAVATAVRGVLPPEGWD